MEQEQNRAKALWRNWEQLENELLKFGAKAGDQDKEIVRQKYEFLRKGLYRLSQRPLNDEKPYLAMIRSVTDRLQKQLYPNRLLRFFHQAKAFLYDKPKVLGQLREQRELNLSGLKAGFERRGLEGISSLLDHYLDYDRQQVSFSVIGKMDDLRSLSVAPSLKQDEHGVFKLVEVNLKLRGSLDPANDVSVSVPGEMLLNRQQMVNLVEQRPVYVMPAVDQEAGLGQWLQVTKGAELGEFKLHVSETGQVDTLQKALNALAEETKVYKLTSAEVLMNLRQGNQFRLTPAHAPDSRFFVEAHPSGKELLLRNEFGEQISKAQLLKSLAHPIATSKGFDLGKEGGKEKGQSSNLDQGLSM